MRVTLFICLCHPLLHSPSLALSSVLIFIPTILPLALSLLLLLFSFTSLSCFSSPQVCCCFLFLSSSSSFSRSLLFYNLFCLSSTSSSIAFLLHFQLFLLATTHLFHPILLCTPRSCLLHSERKVHS